MLLAPANGKLRQYSQHVFTESTKFGKMLLEMNYYFFQSCRPTDYIQQFLAIPQVVETSFCYVLEKYLHNTSYNSFQFGNNVDHKSKCVQPFFSSLMYILWPEKIVYASVIRRELIFQHNHFSLFCHIFFVFTKMTCLLYYYYTILRSIRQCWQAGAGVAPFFVVQQNIFNYHGAEK